MIVLKISPEKFNRIAGAHFGSDKILPLVDNAGNDIISTQVLFNESFAPIMADLESLEPIQYVPYDDITDEEIEIFQARNQELLANYFINNPDLVS